MAMKTGKLPETILKRSVIGLVGHRRKEVVKGPAAGLDCAVISAEPSGDGMAYVLSTDPITGTAEKLGTHCIHVTANDIAASGAEPIGVMLSVLLPPDITEEEIRRIVSDADQTCEKLDMEILGGHTEITDQVTRPLITVTGIGKVRMDQRMDPGKIRPGDELILTKWIGLEATAILARDCHDILSARLPEPLLEEARRFSGYMSVVPDAKAALSAPGMRSMHDVTEGGIFGALWEMAESAGLGLEADVRAIPVRQETIEICEALDVNPYQIMSSGSMLIAAERARPVVAALQSAGIPASVIGRFTEGPARILHNLDEIRYLDRPQPDELYRALENARKLRGQALER